MRLVLGFNFHVEGIFSVRSFNLTSLTLPPSSFPESSANDVVTIPITSKNGRQTVILFTILSSGLSDIFNAAGPRHGYAV
jgi:hypothetical protein